MKYKIILKLIFLAAKNLPPTNFVCNIKRKKKIGKQCGIIIDVYFIMMSIQFRFVGGACLPSFHASLFLILTLIFISNSYFTKQQEATKDRKSEQSENLLFIGARQKQRHIPFWRKFLLLLKTIYEI